MKGKHKIVVSTNSGQPLQPLQKIASGGELSRIMLAIKAVSQNSKDGGTIIFVELVFLKMQKIVKVKHPG